VNRDLDRPALGWLLFAVLLGWSGACGVVPAGVRPSPGMGAGRITVVVALMLSSEVIASDRWVLENQSWPTTLWATNATIVIELAVGLAVGMAAQTARRAHAELQRAARLSASLEERERLSRQVHDGVIQVLALVSRRGREIGGETAELAELAGEQERALRRLVSSADAEGSAGAMTDLGALLRRRAADRVSVSVPANPVLLDANMASELYAAAVNALDNVAQHAGPDARAFVLLEDLGDSVTVSIRDDGVGIASGRLDEAVREGRVGVAKSIVGRLNWLGGSATLSTGPDCGTEWELSVPRKGAS
jgi:signal transduction histidine kinase